MQTKHRYLVITELFLPTKGGTAVWFDEVYRRLGGKEIHIVTAEVPGARAHDAEHPNSVHRVVLRRHRWLRPESLAMYLRLLLAGMSLAWRHDFEAVHAGRVLPEGLIGWVIARLRRIPLLVYAHGEEITSWREPGKRRAMRFTYRRADRVIANSEFTHDELLALGVRPERVTVIHPGVDLERFRPDLPCGDLRERIGVGAGQKLILSVGRLSRRKGFDQVIRALPDLLDHRTEVHHVVIGTGEDQGYLKALADEIGVGERVHLLGHVPMEDLPRWYNAADVFAMPNRELDGDTEGFGMVFLEAAACARPAIAGRAGGTRSAVVHGVTGIVVDGASLVELTDALRRLCQDEPLARTLGHNGYERARKDFSWQRVAANTLALDLTTEHPEYIEKGSE